MVTILYRPGSEHEKAVLDFHAELAKHVGNIRLLDVDSPEGTNFIELQDISQYPAVVVTGPDGSPLQSYQGQLPLISEVSYFAHL